MKIVIDALERVCYILFNLKNKINEQKEYRKMGHYRESALVEVDMKHLWEWVCEMQVEM